MKLSNLAINDPPTVGWRVSKPNCPRNETNGVQDKTRENTRAHRSHHVFWLSHYYPFFSFLSSSQVPPSLPPSLSHVPIHHSYGLLRVKKQT
jgi:hypothetical protein